MKGFQDLAAPAPKVEAAKADQAKHEEKAVAEPVTPGGSVRVEPATPVEPATAQHSMERKPPSKKDKATNDLSVDAIRGRGADFEGEAAVLRGAPEKNLLKKVLPMLYDERDFIAYGEVARYVMVKGSSCFVFGQATDTQPLYAIPLEDVYAVVEDPRKPDKYSVTISPRVNTNEAKANLITVLLKYRRSKKQAYQFTFDAFVDKSAGKRFIDVINYNTKASTAKENTASVLQANAVGKQAAKLQPKI